MNQPAHPPIDVLIVRDPRESVKKCSLTPLRGLAGVRFVEYAPGRIVPVDGRVLLHTEGELLVPADAGRGLLVLDCAWRRVPTLAQVLTGEVVRRRLPPLRTAYPRRSTTFQDPLEGLASVEALYAALALVGTRRPDLLAAYRWADTFLELNRGTLGDDSVS